MRGHCSSHRCGNDSPASAPTAREPLVHPTGVGMIRPRWLLLEARTSSSHRCGNDSALFTDYLLPLRVHPTGVGMIRWRS